MRASQKRVNTADSLGSFHNIYVTDSAVTVCFFLFLVWIYRISVYLVRHTDYLGIAAHTHTHRCFDECERIDASG